MKSQHVSIFYVARNKILKLLMHTIHQYIISSFYTVRNGVTNQLIFINWRDIQNLIRPAAQWPYEVHRLFWKSGLTHFHRILMCTFCYVNGLNPQDFLRMCRAYKLSTGRVGMETLTLFV